MLHLSVNQAPVWEERMENWADVMFRHQHGVPQECNGPHCKSFYSSLVTRGWQDQIVGHLKARTHPSEEPHAEVIAHRPIFYHLMHDSLDLGYRWLENCSLIHKSFLWIETMDSERFLFHSSESHEVKHHSGQAAIDSFIIIGCKQFCFIPNS